ncbi:hypothetical protein [Streptomyces mangrovisoli]|uniref:SnoaL-like domain-containing protein n=1 Tax=Streptomyces mangrovisoli TaxID=1428628 RepID=A0A1J4NRK6_9ACTN|nr:hypothetical protein [Streptomyces mangrovisoli]OIJ65015.1 hypothetical protein WN71_025785 [Streptomyces mangrovisoli]
MSDQPAGTPANGPAYRFDGPLATIESPEFFRTWMDDEVYFERLVRSADPLDAERKRVAVGFQRDLARLAATGSIADRIDDLLATYLAEDYQQHDDHLADGRGPLADFFKGAEAKGVDLWPPMPIVAMADGEIVSLLLQGVSERGVRFIPTMFRVADGVLTEHWSAAAPPPPPQA